MTAPPDEVMGAGVATPATALKSIPDTTPSTQQITPLGVSVPLCSVPDAVVAGVQNRTPAPAITTTTLKLPDALEDRLVALADRVDAVERAICVGACSGPPSCSLRCPTPLSVREYHQHVSYIDSIEVVR